MKDVCGGVTGEVPPPRFSCQTPPDGNSGLVRDRGTSGPIRPATPRSASVIWLPPDCGTRYPEAPDGAMPMMVQVPVEHPDPMTDAIDAPDGSVACDQLDADWLPVNMATGVLADVDSGAASGVVDAFMQTDEPQTGDVGMVEPNASACCVQDTVRSVDDRFRPAGTGDV